MADVRSLRDDFGTIDSHNAIMALKAEKSWFLKEWREKRRLSQQALADAADTSKGYVSDLESGTRRFNQDHLERFSAIFGIKPRDLLSPPDEVEEDPNVDPIPVEFVMRWRAASRAQKRQLMALSEILAPTSSTGTDDE